MSAPSNPPSGPDLSGHAAMLRRLLGAAPDWALVFGSGLAGAARGMGLQPLAHFAEVGLPAPGVHGHSGTVSGGRLSDSVVLAFEGRAHLYEGHNLEAVTRAVRLAVAAGARRLVLTNAAGGLAPGLAARHLMLARDHISLPGLLGYAGAEDAAAGRYPWPRFLSQDEVYDAGLAREAQRAAADLGIALREGTYGMVWGPLYESPAERTLLSRLGADAVGMSSVPEAVMARALGARVLMLSVITNAATDVEPPSHEEVTRQSLEASDALARLLRRLITGPPDS